MRKARGPDGHGRGVCGHSRGSTLVAGLSVADPSVAVTGEPWPVAHGPRHGARVVSDPCARRCRTGALDRRGGGGCDRPVEVRRAGSVRARRRHSEEEQPGDDEEDRERLQVPCTGNRASTAHSHETVTVRNERPDRWHRPSIGCSVAGYQRRLRVAMSCTVGDRSRIPLRQLWAAAIVDQVRPPSLESCTPCSVAAMKRSAPSAVNA